MKNTFYLREEFIQWLTTSANLPLASARSYCSYVAAVDSNIALDREDLQTDFNLFSLLQKEVEQGNDFRMDNIIISIINHLSQEGIETSLGKPLSSISKWKSALLQYREFLYDFIESTIEQADPSESSTNEDTTVYPSELFDFDFQHSDDQPYNGSITLDDPEMNRQPKKWIYKKEELYKIFRFRLITQDRYYNEIFYPISFIKRLCYKLDQKEFFDQWINGLLDKTVIHYEDGHTTLGKITSLSVAPADVLISLDKKTRFVLTKKSDNITLVPLVVPDLKKIALDHDKPLLNIMRENVQDLRSFMTITNELKKHIEGKVTAKKLKHANNSVLTGDYANLVNMIELKNEMNLIAQHTRLQLMDSGQNSIKGVIDLL